MIVLTCKQTRVFRLALVIIAKSRSFPVKRLFADEPMQSRFCRGNEYCFCLCRSLSCRLSAVKRKERRIDRPFFFEHALDSASPQVRRAVPTARDLSSVRPLMTHAPPETRLPCRPQHAPRRNVNRACSVPYARSYT